MSSVIKILINLFCYQEKGFMHMNTWIVGKDLMKHCYLIKKDFQSNSNIKDIRDTDYELAKKVQKDLEIKKSRQIS